MHVHCSLSIFPSNSIVALLSPNLSFLTSSFSFHSEFSFACPCASIKMDTHVYTRTNLLSSSIPNSTTLLISSSSVSIPSLPCTLKPHASIPSFPYTLKPRPIFFGFRSVWSPSPKKPWTLAPVPSTTLTGWQGRVAGRGQNNAWCLTSDTTHSSPSS